METIHEILMKYSYVYSFDTELHSKTFQSLNQISGPDSTFDVLVLTFSIFIVILIVIVQILLSKLKKIKKKEKGKYLRIYI